MHTDLRETHNVGGETREWLVTEAVCPALSEHGLRLVGRSIARHGFRFVRPRPTFGQVLACVAGEGRVLVDGQWRSCGAGEAYVTPPGRPHAYEAVRGKRWELAWALLAHTPRSPLAHVESPRLERCDTAALRAAIVGLYGECAGPADLSLMRQWAGLVFMQARRVAAPGDTTSRLAPLWEAVDADLARAWNVARLAELAGVSGEHLRRLCVDQHGCSPMRYVARLRLHRAAAFLATTPWPIADVARAVGYDNAFAFSTAFRRQFGETPSKYRAAR